MCFSFTGRPEAPTPNGPESQSGVEEDAAEKDKDGSEDEWEQVGPRNKTSITRQADFVRTPITDIFGGHIRYVDGWIRRADLRTVGHICVFCPSGFKKIGACVGLACLNKPCVWLHDVCRGF